MLHIKNILFQWIWLHRLRCVFTLDVSRGIILTMIFSNSMILFEHYFNQAVFKARYYDDMWTWGAYELAIYNGRETLEITDQNVWSRIECNMTIFMNIVLLWSSDNNWRRCPACHTSHCPRDNSGKFIVDWYISMLLIDDAVHLSADSWNCDRRLQSGNNINDSLYRAQVVNEKDLELICNIHIYKRVASLTYHGIQADIFPTLGCM